MLSIFARKFLLTFTILDKSADKYKVDFFVLVYCLYVIVIIKTTAKEVKISAIISAVYAIHYLNQVMSEDK